MSKITLKTIADELNVSINTVSKALRGMPGVSDEMREKIIQLAQELGYKKNNTHLGSDNSISISLICRKSFFEDPTFWSHVLFGIWNFSGQNNISIRTVPIDPGGENDTVNMAAITGAPSNGYIVIGTINDELLKKIISTKVPTVVVDYYSNDVDCDYINSANDKGIYMAVKYLYQNNHKNIGFINNKEGAYTFHQRYIAFLKYMEYFKLPVDERFVWHDAVYNDTMHYTGYYIQKIKALRHLSNFPTAWVCVNDSTALAFYNALKELEIKVPDDVSIIGFDNISSIYEPFLTTIDVPQVSMGQRAVQQLLYRIKHPGEPFISIQMNTTLIERSSVKNLAEINKDKNEM